MNVSLSTFTTTKNRCLNTIRTSFKSHFMPLEFFWQDVQQIQGDELRPWIEKWIKPLVRICLQSDNKNLSFEYSWPSTLFQFLKEIHLRNQWCFVYFYHVIVGDAYCYNKLWFTVDILLTFDHLVRQHLIYLVSVK